MTQLKLEFRKRKMQARGKPCPTCGTDLWWMSIRKAPEGRARAGTRRMKCVECHRRWTRRKFGQRACGEVFPCANCFQPYVLTRANRRYCSVACRRVAEMAKRPPRDTGGPCEACGETQPQRWWDHDHATGAFRGWLCNGCNSALGFAKDNPARLRALAAYLERHAQSAVRQA